MKSTFIGEIFCGRFQGKTSTLHFDINKLDYIKDAVYHLQTTGVFSSFNTCFPVFNVLRNLESIQPPKQEVQVVLHATPSLHALGC